MSRVMPTLLRLLQSPTFVSFHSIPSQVVLTAVQSQKSTTQKVGDTVSGNSNENQVGDSQ